MNNKYLVVLGSICCLCLLMRTTGQAQNNEQNYTLVDTIRGNTSMIAADSLYAIKEYEASIEQRKLAKEIFTALYGTNHPLVMMCWEKIGLAYYRIDDYEQAITNQLVAIDLYKKEFGEDYSNIGEILGNIGIYYSNLGKFQLALKYDKQCIRFKEKYEKENTIFLAGAYESIAATYQYLSKVDSALIFHDKTLVLRKKVFGESSYQVARTLDAMGSAYRQISNFSKQIDFTLRALKIFERILNETHPSRIKCYGNLGHAYRGLGDFENAIKYHQLNLDLAKKAHRDSNPRLAISYNNLAVDYIEIGNYRKAVFLAEQALNHLPKQYSKNFFMKGDFYNTLGRCYNEMGDSQRAIDFYEKSLFVKLKNAKENAVTLSITYHNLATNYIIDGDQETALDFYKKALKSHLGSFEEIHASTPMYYHGMGLVYLNLKDYEKATFFIQKSYDIRVALFGEGHISLAESLNGLGDIAYTQKNYVEAASLYKKAIDLKIKKFGPIHPEIGSLLLELARCHYKNGLQTEAQKASEDALVAFDYCEENNFQSVNQIDGLIYLLDFVGTFYKVKFEVDGEVNNLLKAKDIYQQAIDAIHYKASFISNNSQDDLVKIAKPIYNRAIRINYLLLENTENTAEQITYLFNLAEQSKSTILLGAIRKSNAINQSNIPDSLMDRKQNIALEIVKIKKSKQDKIQEVGVTDDTTFLKLANNLSDLEIEMEQIEKSLKENYPIYESATFNPIPTSVTHIQDKLTADQTVLEYVTGDSFSYVFLINPDTIIIREVKMDFDLKEWVTKCLAGLTKFHSSKNLPRSMLSPLTKQYVLYANKIHQKFLAPLDDFLNTELLILPDGALGYLPFELLLPTKPIDLVSFHKYPYLINSHILNYCYFIAI